MPAAANKLKPFMEGRNSSLIVFQQNQRRNFPFKSKGVKPNVTKHADGVNGEDRDRLSVTLNYYEGSAEMYVGDLQFLTDWLEAQKARDAKTAPLDQTGALRFYPNDGTKKTYILQEFILDEWDLKDGGRSEKKMVTFNYRFTDIVESKAKR